MPVFNYNEFKAAIQKVKEEKHNELINDVNQINAFIEKVLTMSFESNANIARMNYPGIDL